MNPTTPMNWLRMLGGLAAAAALCLPQLAHAAGYPQRQVRIVVPVGPGGGADQIARLLAKGLGEEWNQTVIVENKPGAELSLGAMTVAQAAPDGHTLFFTPAPAVTVNPLVLPNLKYGLDDFAPVMIVTQAPFLLMVNKGLGVSSVAELIAAMRASPGKLNNAYNSTSTRLTSELLKSMAQVNYEEVPYRGGAQNALSTISGETDMTFVDMGSAMPLLQNDRIAVLAITTPARSKIRPDIPTMAESGLQGFSSSGYSVLLAPARTPPETIAAINASLQKVMRRPDVVERIEAMGNEAMTQAPDQARDILVEDSGKWAKLIRDRDIRLN